MHADRTEAQIKGELNGLPKDAMKVKRLIAVTSLILIRAKSARIRG